MMNTAPRQEDDRVELERKVDRLQNTLQALARETSNVTLHGPCPACGQCLLFLKRNTMYCPCCGDGQNL